MATEVPKSLEKIGKKKKKFLAKRLKHCDPTKIEEMLKGQTTGGVGEIVKSFKNKPNHKKKKRKPKVTNPKTEKKEDIIEMIDNYESRCIPTRE